MRYALRRGLEIYNKKGLLAMIGAGSSYLGDLIEDTTSFVRNDLEGAKKYDIGLRTRVKAWKRGFNAKTWAWLRMDENLPEEYVNNIFAGRTLFAVNGRYGEILTDSLAFYHSSSSFRDYFPEHYGTIEDGQFCTRGFGHDREVSKILEEQGDLIIKPICGTQGKGVKRVRQDQTTVNELLDITSELDEYLVTDYVDQHEYSSDIAPKSSNTIRIYTIIDPDTRDPYLVRATHRFGTSETAPTDNWSKGGLCAPVDVETGTLGTAIIQNSSDGMMSTKSHPETDAQIKDVEIPHWDMTREVILEMAAHHRRAPFVGWDVIVTDDGPRIIEANNKPGIHLLQIGGGLLDDEVGKRFVKKINTF